ncbi:fumarylacetoacetate hydrolase family protein [Thermobifida halotolerans]|uniref:fumarylacetoacetate hydrolase family protein n=1 Tax=Thermobifida halotolerans TaxID=483545 RepID=UPI0008392DCE|nr:fumarylacetoacetate hydrolase family protein [Thermobifida halotolerans]
MATPAAAERFALGTFEAPDGRVFPGLVRDQRVRDLTDAITGGVLPCDGPPALLGLLRVWDDAVPRLAELAAADDGWRDGAGLRVRAPLTPGQVLQSGANYRTHVIDLVVAHRDPDDPRDEEQVRAEAAAFMDRRAAEGEPYLFVGLPSAVCGPDDDVVLPAYSDQHDWELELAAVIGRPAFRVSPEQALDHVAGYTIANDITTRDLVFRRDMPDIGTDWLRAKNAPTFLPLGPWLVPAEFVPDPMDLRIRLTLNGRVMQDETTKDMIFDVARLVSAASQTVPLSPGDLVLTGSPAGNGMHWGRLLRPGDVMESTITGLGVQRNRCVAEEAR